MTHVAYQERPVLNAKVGMRKIRKNRHNLILMSKGRDEWADRRVSPEIVQQFQLVLNSKRTARHIYLF